MEQEIDLLSIEEELSPELLKCVVNRNGVKIIQHPLIVTFYSPKLFALTNAQLKTAKELLKMNEERRNWQLYLSVYARAFRVDGFIYIKDKLTDIEYWSNLSCIWMHSENITEDLLIWKILFNSNRACREYLMNPEERTYFNSLPDTIKIYQGYSGNSKNNGWTLSKDVAIFFAKRYGGSENNVREKIVKKSDCLCYLNDREEEEIIYFKK